MLKNGSDKRRSNFESLRSKMMGDVKIQHDTYVNNLVDVIKLISETYVDTCAYKAIRQ